MNKINFPSTKNAPTDGSFKYNNNGRTWVWNGVYWGTPEEDDISYDSANEVLTYVNRLGISKNVNFSFINDSILEDFALSIETRMSEIVLDSAAQPTGGGLSIGSISLNSPTLLSTPSQDMDAIQRVVDALTIKINELKNAINQMKSLQIDIQNSLGGDQYTPLYSDTTNFIQDINRIKQEQQELQQKNLDLDSLISSMKSNISGGSDWTGISDSSNTIRDEISYVSQKMDDIKTVVENSGIDPNTDFQSLITSLNSTKAQLLGAQASGQGVTLDDFEDALSSVPQMETDIENIRVSVGLDSAFEYSSSETSETTIKGHIAELHTNKIDSNLKNVLGGVATIDSEGKIIRETLTSLEYFPDENKLVYTDELDSANEIVLQDVLTSLTYEEEPDDPNVEKYNRLVYTDEKGHNSEFYIKGALTSLSYDQQSEMLKYKDESGSEYPVQVPQQIAELYYDNIKDSLIFKNKSGIIKEVQYPRVDKKTELRYDDNSKQLVYVNEADVEYRVKFPDTLTTLEIDSHNDLVYKDENGVVHTIPIPETQTKIELDSAGLLVHTNEEGVQPAIDIRTNKVWLSSPGNPKEGDLYYVQDSTGLRVYYQNEWVRAGYSEISTDRIVSISGSGSMIAEGDFITSNSSLIAEGNVEIKGKLTFFADSSLEGAIIQNDFIEFDTSDNSSLNLGILCNYELSDIDSAAEERNFSPKLTVNSDSVLVTSSSRDYSPIGDNITKKIDMTVSNHFISIGSSELLWLDDGLYKGQEMNFILQNIDGDNSKIQYRKGVRILIKNSIFTGDNSSSFNTGTGQVLAKSKKGMEIDFKEIVNGEQIGYTFDEISEGIVDIKRCSIDDNNIGIIWHLNNIKPAYRQNDFEWVYRDDSPLIYNCIWNGNSWILNGGNVQRISTEEYNNYTTNNLNRIVKKHWETE